MFEFYFDNAWSSCCFRIRRRLGGPAHVDGLGVAVGLLWPSSGSVASGALCSRSSRCPWSKAWSPVISSASGLTTSCGRICLRLLGVVILARLVGLTSSLTSSQVRLSGGSGSGGEGLGIARMLMPLGEDCRCLLSGRGMSRSPREHHNRR